MTTAIIGAGLAGLSTAFHLGREADVVVFEAEPQPGGLCRTNRWEGFTFDYCGHQLHMTDPYVRSLMDELLGEELVALDRRARIAIQGCLTDYPFQLNTHGLPSAIVKDCLLGVIQANYEPPEQEPETFEDWILASCGKGVAKHFMFPYNEKLWRVPPSQMSIDWIGRFIPKTTIEEAVEGALGRTTRKVGYNATFYYPRNGGIQSLPDAFAEGLPEDSLRLGDPVVRIDTASRRVTTETDSFSYSRLVSTVPLPKLVELLGPVPISVRNAANRLRSVSVMAACIAVKGPQNNDSHWVYVPEPKYAAYRIGLPSNLVPGMAPNGCKSYIAEISYSDWHPIDHERVLQQTIDDLTQLGFLTDDDKVLFTRLVKLPYAYVLYDMARERAISTINKFLEDVGILSIGRYGRWEYSAMEDAILNGRRTAMLVLNG